MQDVVATPLQYSGPRSSRNLEERIIVRFPRTWRALSALVQRRLSPRSRVRRALLRRNVVSGWNASSRRDYELLLVRYAPGENDDLQWPHRDGLIWPHFSSVVVGVDVD
jgi:hypothetical protein